MKRLLLALGLLTAAAVTWWLWPDDDDRPEVYDITGDHPGDLMPGLAVDDNVRHYGPPFDIPYRFETNYLGFRGPAPTAGDGPTVVLMGDSFVFGMGVDEGETAADHLRAALPDATIHNAGVPGYTITDHLEQWDDKLAALAPDVILLFHTASDLKEMARPGSLRRALSDDAIDPADYVFSQEQLLERLGAAAPARLATMRTAYADGVIELAGKVKAAGGRFALILWVDGYGMANLDAAPVAAAVRTAGFPVFDGNGRLRRQGEVPFDQLFLPDSHFSAKGNALVGRQTAEWLTEEIGL